MAIQKNGDITTGFFAVNEKKLNALVGATQGEFRKATSNILRFQEDVYRKTIFQSAAQFNMGGKSLYQAIDAATKDFLAAGIHNIRYKDGRQVNIASYAEMALRTANLRANIQGEAAKRDEWGISTVKMSAHGSACPKCIPWQGKVYYDDVYGSAPVPQDKKYPLLSAAIEGGALHPNCKNGVSTWFEGINAPPREMTEAEIKEANRRYDLEQEQRYCERNVRKYKRLKLGALDEETAAKYAAKEKQWRDRMKKLIADNPDVLRMEQARLKIYDTPKPPQAGTGTIPKTKTPVGSDMKKAVSAVPNDAGAVEIKIQSPPTTNGGDGDAYQPEKISEKPLTSGGESGTLKMGKSKGVYQQNPPDFFKYEVKTDLNAVNAVKESLIRDFGLSENDVKFDGIKNADVLEPFVSSLHKIQEETNFRLPKMIAVDVIDGDQCCIAGYKPMEDRFYISSRYFNSKEALLDTLKDWTSNGILPKQAKSIRYLAEHEAAHMRTPDEILQSEEAFAIWKKRKLMNRNDEQIYEYFADAIAIYRTNLNVSDSSIISAIEFMKNGGVNI